MIVITSQPSTIISLYASPGQYQCSCSGSAQHASIKQEPLDLEDDYQVDVQGQDQVPVDIPAEFQAPAAAQIHQQVGGDTQVGIQAAHGLAQAVPGPSQAAPDLGQGLLQDGQQVESTTQAGEIRKD